MFLWVFDVWKRKAMLDVNCTRLHSHSHIRSQKLFVIEILSMKTFSIIVQCQRVSAYLQEPQCARQFRKSTVRTKIDKSWVDNMNGWRLTIKTTNRQLWWGISHPSKFLMGFLSAHLCLCELGSGSKGLLTNRAWLHNAFFFTERLSRWK